MLGELFGSIMDEFNSMSNDMAEKANRGILRGAWALASTRATLDGFDAMTRAIAAPAPAAPRF